MSQFVPLAERKVIVFDFDGTIADTKASIISTATRVLSGMGVSEHDLERVGDIIGPPFPQAFEEVFGLSHADAVEATRRYRDIYTKLGIEAWPAFEGMCELLADLVASGRMLAIASSKRTPLVETGLRDNSILELFSSVRAKESDDKMTKEDSIRLALQDLGATPHEAVMVGDRFHDVEAAHACEVDCVGVLYGNTADRSELAGAGAVAIAETMDELREILTGSRS